MAMQDVQKTNIKRRNSVKRMRRRNRMMPLYMLLVLLLVVGVGIALSVTVFFNVKTFRVEGDAEQYTPQQIIDVTGIQCGDNMVRLNTASAEKKVLDQLIYIEEVSIQKHYPNELVIQVKRCQETFNIETKDGVLLTSVSGKILAASNQPMDQLPVVKGFEAVEQTPGKQLTSKDAHKEKIFQILSQLQTEELAVPITSVDLTDKYNIVVWFDNRIEFELGNWSDMAYKVHLAETAMEQIGAGKNGVLSMVGNNQCSFRTQESIQASQEKLREQKQQAQQENRTDSEGDATTEDQTEDLSGTESAD